MKGAVAGALLLATVVAGGAAAADRCGTMAATAYELVAHYFHADHPDSLYGLVLAWDDLCGPSETVERTRILAAIWDDAFDDSIYGDDILDLLVEYGATLRRGPDPAADDPRERYDAFTVTVADQLLPHQEQGSLELFFCLYYGGRIDEAWALLGSPEMESCYLRDAWRGEIEVLSAPRPETVVSLTGGYWSVGGDAAFVGDKALPGVMVGLRGDEWLGRFLVDVRVGRADEPYTASTDLTAGRSDRWNQTHVGMELGRTADLVDRLELDVFGGVGANFIEPFAAEDHLIVAVQGSVGAGLRAALGARRVVLVGVDVKHDWWANGNSAGSTPLGGSAWVVRAAVALKLDKGRNARLRALGR